LNNFWYIEKARRALYVVYGKNDYMLLFWMPIGTDIFGYPKALEMLILRHLGKMIGV
jgi:hypothetical protein